MTVVANPKTPPQSVRDHRHALASKMIEIDRRELLGLTHREVWRRGGPADSAQADLENAGLSHVLPSNFRKVDAGLGWEPGTAASLFHTGLFHTGQRPERTERPAAATRATRDKIDDWAAWIVGLLALVGFIYVLAINAG